MKNMIYVIILLMTFPWLAGAGTFFAVNSTTHNLWLSLFVAGTIAGDLGFHHRHNLRQATPKNVQRQGRQVKVVLKAKMRYYVWNGGTLVCSVNKKTLIVPAEHEYTISGDKAKKHPPPRHD